MKPQLCVYSSAACLHPPHPHLQPTEGWLAELTASCRPWAPQVRRLRTGIGEYTRIRVPAELRFLEDSAHCALWQTQEKPLSTMYSGQTLQGTQPCLSLLLWASLGSSPQAPKHKGGQRGSRGVVVAEVGLLSEANVLTTPPPRHGNGTSTYA